MEQMDLYYFSDTYIHLGVTYIKHKLSTLGSCNEAEFDLYSVTTFLIGYMQMS